MPGDFKVGLIVADDLKGAGTDRYEYEFTFRFGPDRTLGSPPKRSRWLKDYWLTGVLWSSESPSERAVREAILTAAHRVAYMHQHGPARTLREMLAQEGQVMALAGCSGPTLEAEDTAYTREVLIPHLGAAGAALASATALVFESACLFFVAKFRLGFHCLIFGRPRDC